MRIRRRRGWRRKKKRRRGRKRRRKKWKKKKISFPKVSKYHARHFKDMFPALGTEVTGCFFYGLLTHPLRNHLLPSMCTRISGPKENTDLPTQGEATESASCQSLP